MKKISKIVASIIACVGLILTVTSCAGGVNEVKTTYKGKVNSVSGSGTENGITKTVEYSFSDVKLDYIETPTGESIVVMFTENYKTTSTGSSDNESSYPYRNYYTLYKDSDGLFINYYGPVLTTIETLTSTEDVYNYNSSDQKIRVKKDGKNISFTIPATYQIKYDENHNSTSNWFEDDYVELKFEFTEE